MRAASGMRIAASECESAMTRVKQQAKCTPRALREAAPAVDGQCEVVSVLRWRRFGVVGHGDDDVDGPSPHCLSKDGPLARLPLVEHGDGGERRQVEGGR
eukprot:531974-Pleurochrysis_carterae.AAC.1